jgi:micrococcal nuclease
MKALNKIALIWLLTIIFIAYYFYKYPLNVTNLPFFTSSDITPQPSTDSINNTSYKINKVIDGDTIEVLIGDKIEKVRLIGINTPETVDPRRPVQCFGKESSDKAKEILNGKKVKLESDPTQSDRDEFGRLLRYVYLEDGTFVNKIMIQAGYAFEYTYQTPYKYRDEFLKSQIQASDQKLGLWSPTSCNGQLKSK